MFKYSFSKLTCCFLIVYFIEWGILNLLVMLDLI